MPANPLPLKRKLENAVIAFLNANKADTAFANLQIVSGHGTAVDPDTEEVQEPDLPFLAVFVQTQTDPDLPRTSAFELVLHLKSDATAEDALRVDVDALLRDLYDVLATPAPGGYDEILGDENREFGAFLAAANKPAVAPDARGAECKDLHVYGLWSVAELTLFADDLWHDQLSFAGHAQDHDSHDYEEAEP